ncbi:hypothetical protein [Vulcanisaeta sp. JCM 14467]|uniref:hypothetical protein n=1 Tax=Vulcanisaeta sp. JCM 14467 TaxID=1295370 RepID=UPI002092AA89|nr:hypothetical protein [Vulcanisaeta sp. JCM 14467]
MCVKGYRYADFITNPCNRCKFNVINTNTKKLIDELVKANINEYVQIKDMAEIKGFCPYYVQEQMVRRLLNEHDNLVVLMNYGRVRKFSRYVSNIVIDEAHNIMMPRVVRLPRKVINIILEKNEYKHYDECRVNQRCVKRAHYRDSDG